jgi:haloacetate dehalogenase
MNEHSDATGLFWGFSTLQLPVNGTMIKAVRGGSGPPVLLLHGYPQTHAMWHRVAPLLADKFTVVCPDLQGYGDSAKPDSDESHEPYSKRVMAQDQLELMRTLGFERFALVGHDRGARVARRLALDHPDAVSHLAVLDIVPTATIYATLDQRRATTVWRYFFLVQPRDLPERLIGADPGFYLDRTLAEWCRTPGSLDETAVSEYRRGFDEKTVHASCEDYRAGATIDLVHDEADNERRISCPTLVLWSAHGIGSSYDVLAIWREEAEAARTRARLRPLPRRGASRGDDGRTGGLPQREACVRPSSRFADRSAPTGGRSRVAVSDDRLLQPTFGSARGAA